MRKHARGCWGDPEAVQADDVPAHDGLTVDGGGSDSSSSALWRDRGARGSESYQQEARGWCYRRGGGLCAPPPHRRHAMMRAARLRRTSLYPAE